MTADKFSPSAARWRLKPRLTRTYRTHPCLQLLAAFEPASATPTEAAVHANGICGFRGRVSYTYAKPWAKRRSSISGSLRKNGAPQLAPRLKTTTKKSLSALGIDVSSDHFSTGFPYLPYSPEASMVSICSWSRPPNCHPSCDTDPGCEYSAYSARFSSLPQHIMLPDDF